MTDTNMGTAAYNPIQPSILARFGAWMRARSERNRTITDLSRLSDRELTDIGITRGDIRRIADGITDVYRGA